mmetsp:Transcript_19248/g.57428  ORF Transcript_19248/g.57428 Transcript_19248/m.57428 type:complete len:173 (-) Transcript_19248:407-925(-)
MRRAVESRAQPAPSRRECRWLAASAARSAAAQEASAASTQLPSARPRWRCVRWLMVRRSACSRARWSTTRARHALQLPWRWRATRRSMTAPSAISLATPPSSSCLQLAQPHASADVSSVQLGSDSSFQLGSARFNSVQLGPAERHRHCPSLPSKCDSNLPTHYARHNAYRIG